MSRATLILWSHVLMNWQTLDDVNKTLETSLRGKLCVQAWLGIGQVLFIGFGDTVLPPIPHGELHAVPTYELQTGFTDW